MTLMNHLKGYYSRIVDWLVYTDELHDTPSLRDILQKVLEGCTGSDYTNRVLEYFDSMSGDAVTELMTIPPIGEDVSDNRYNNIIRTILAGMVYYDVSSAAGTTISRKGKRWDRRDAKTRSAELEQTLFEDYDAAFDDEWLDRNTATMKAESIPDYVEMDEHLLAGICGTDAHAWAVAFQQIVVERDITVDEDLMLGWFANAIETARGRCDE